MTHSVGSLVRARGRDWVVLPESDEELLVLRPLGGTDLEVAGVLTSLEKVEPSTFALPSVKDLGDTKSARMLTDALKLGFRASAGPFRSFGQLGFEPRPYQFVPLMMALKLDPVRLLIADDVGVGKTAETLMIAKELLAQGEITRLAILCPPHLATQWQQEMAEKFGLGAELVLASTAAALERGCRTGETLFDHFPITVVSSDFIKAERRRAEFLRTAPEMIIVDEAHAAAADTRVRSARHQRYELIKALAQKPERHLILVTATPHSGNEGAFRSLLGLLREDFAELPEDLSGDANRRIREQVARHLVQRRRANLRAYLGDTEFPERLSREAPYQLTEEYKLLLNKALAYAQRQAGQRQTSAEPDEARRMRVRWWSALALLRAIASSPAAAAVTLRKRAQTQGVGDPEEVERISRQRVMDLFGDDDGAEVDEELGVAEDANAEDGNAEDGPTTGLANAPYSAERRTLYELARLADGCMGAEDAKLMMLVDEVKGLLDQGFVPIIFCRFIATADYLARELQERLKGVEIRAVTGDVPSSKRGEIVDELASHPKRVLVATDCLSEGINLQDYFNSVIHYDLSWNPTRHEQREGRVDRFGQPSKEVRVITCYGNDNRIDGLVMEVLLRKHQSIRNSLGISIPVPGDPNTVVETLIRGVLSEGERLGEGTQLTLEGLGPAEREIATAWEASARREEVLRTIFAQNTLGPDVVAKELDALKEAVGTVADIKRFTSDVLRSVGGTVSGDEPLVLTLNGAPRAVAELAGGEHELSMRFDSPVRTPRERRASRVEPFIAGLSSWVIDSALDNSGPAARAGVRRSNAVSVVTTLTVVRLRFELRTRNSQLLAEDVLVSGFQGLGSDIVWLDSHDALSLLDAPSTGNVASFQAEEFINQVLNGYEKVWRDDLVRLATQRGEVLKESHRRVRDATRRSGEVDVSLMLPLDVIGLYVLLPDAASGGTR
ncbi:MAG: DEAD/DEAH box helicase [Gammaproteobacteria bacterium]|nr:DEAD/DEAH box helicase [Gammaproteobacteria bacterium]